MELFFSKYFLQPKYKANHSATLASKAGVLLKAHKSNRAIVDYFPHENLGDESIDQFLGTFPNPQNSYHKSIINQLHLELTPLPQVTFLNHQLWTPGAAINSPVVKYKIMGAEDSLPQEILSSDCRIRLDANGLFEKNSLFKFLSRMQIKTLSRIDYIEDPLSSLDWTNLPIPAARDFIQGTPFQNIVYKPNREYLPELNGQTIFSGYMGSLFGLVYAYKELIQRGNLELYHGLITPDLYQDEIPLFKGNYVDGFRPDPKVYDQLFENIQDQTWTYLCSI